MPTIVKSQAGGKVVTSRGDAYAHICSGVPHFHVVESVALFLLEAEVRQIISIRKVKAGVPDYGATASEIDSVIGSDYNVEKLDQFQVQALDDIIEYTQKLYSTQTRTVFKIPVAVWQGMWGNLLTVLVVLSASGLAHAYGIFQNIDLVKDIKSFTHWFLTHWSR